MADIEKAIKYITDTKTYEELGSKYKQAVKHYPELLDNKEFQDSYSQIRDELVPKIKTQSKCKSCGMPVDWVKMKPSEKMNPLCLPVLTYSPYNKDLLKDQYFKAFGDDLDETKLHGDVGNLIVVTDLGYAAKISEVLEGRVSHFFNCTDADKHRKKGK